MTESRRREVELLDRTVAYAVRESDAATRPRIDVDASGVTVVLPESAGISPTAVLSDHAEWVVEKDREYDAYREKIPERRHEAGATFPYLGRDHEVVVERRSYSVVDDDALRLAAHHVEETSVKRALETLYRRKARERFEERASHYAAAIGVAYDRIEVRNQRTKWGSCSTSGTLSLNWRLVMAPPRILEYVVLHEVAHLVEMSHSETFWAVVGEHDPEWESHRAWLEENGGELVFSEADL